MAKSVLGDALRTTFLAGVGALSFVGEKGGQLISSLAERGEQAVSAGRDLNQELVHAVSDAAADAREGLLKTRIELMTPEERTQFVEAVQRVSTQVAEEQAARAAAEGHRPPADPCADAAAGCDAPDAACPCGAPGPVKVPVVDSGLADASCRATAAGEASKVSGACGCADATPSDAEPAASTSR